MEANQCSPAALRWVTRKIICIRGTDREDCPSNSKHNVVESSAVVVTPTMTYPNELMPVHGGYRKLKTFQIAQLIYDVTVRFCERYINKRSRTHDQMVQAARSGVQNIAEGSVASGTRRRLN